MRRYLLIAIGAFAVVYLGIGAAYRICCLKDGGVPMLRYTVGAEQYETGLALTLKQPFLNYLSGDSRATRVLFRVLNTIYAYPIGWVEHRLQTHAGTDASILERFHSISRNANLKDGTELTTFGTSFDTVWDEAGNPIQ